MPDVDEEAVALRWAAERAIAYRRDVAAADRTPTADYDMVHTAFDRPLPQTGDESEAIIAEMATLAEPGLRASTAPRFYGWVIGGSDLTGVAADWLASAWGQNAANMSASPAAAAVEAVVESWLLELLGLPSESSVGFVSGATIANLVGLAAARSELLRRVGWDVEADGLAGAPPLPVLIGADAHATVFSAIKLLGLGARQVTIVAADATGRMLPEALAEAIAAAPAAPLVIAQAGQICTGACDPFEAIAPMVCDAGGWLHVDGAFGLWAQASPRFRHLTTGMELADSWATDGHKWLQLPYDSGFAIVRDRAAHQRALAVAASYLPPVDDGQRNPSDFVPELSRRARGFAAWAVIRRLGRDGIVEVVDRCCAVAQRIADRLADTPGIAIVAPVVLNQLMLRFGDDDSATRATVAALQEEAIAFAGPSLWRGQWVMRISVSSAATTLADADVTADAIRSAWQRVQAGR